MLEKAPYANKRVACIAVFMAIVLALGFAANCASAEQAYAAPSYKSVYKKVLKNINSPKYKPWAEMSDKAYKKSFFKYALMNIDRKGKPELVVWMQSNPNANRGCLFAIKYVKSGKSAKAQSMTSRMGGKYRIGNWDTRTYDVVFSKISKKFYWRTIESSSGRVLYNAMGISSPGHFNAPPLVSKNWLNPEAAAAVANQYKEVKWYETSDFKGLK